MSLQPTPSILPSATSNMSSSAGETVAPPSNWDRLGPHFLRSRQQHSGSAADAATPPPRASNDGAAAAAAAPPPPPPGLLDLTRRLSSLQRAAEAAGRTEPLLRTQRQLRAIWAYIGAAPPLAGLTPSQQLSVARSVVMIRTRRGEVVVREGSLGSFFYVVLAGAYAVWQRAAAGASPYNRCLAPVPPPFCTLPYPSVPATHPAPRRTTRRCWSLHYEPWIRSCLLGPHRFRPMLAVTTATSDTSDLGNTACPT